MDIKVKRLHPKAVIPQYATEGAACFDLHAVLPDDVDVYIVDDTLSSSSYRVFRTGLAFEIPKGFAMLIYSRSGHGFKHDIRLANCVGVIDSDYRGEVLVKLRSDYNGYLQVNAGDRIAQAMIIPIPRIGFAEASELGGTVRSVGGFGSTGS